MKSLRRHTGALRLLDDRIDGIESILRGRRSEKENLPSSSIDLDAGADSIHTVRKAWCMWAWLHKNYDAFDKMKPFCLEYGQFLKTIEALPIDALVDIRGFLLDHMPPKDKNPWMRANRLQPLELYLSGAWASFHERDDRPWADEVWFLSIVKRIDTGRIDMAIGFLEEYLKKASSSRKPIVMRRLRALNDTRKALEITPASVSSAISDCTSRVLNAR